MDASSEQPLSCRKLLDTQPLTIQYTGAFPDNLKLIKTISVPPLKLIGAAYVNPRTQKFGYSISCKENLFGGNISYLASAHALAYRKSFALPGMPQAVVAAEYPIGQHWRSTRVRVGLGYADADGSGDISMPAPNTLTFRRSAFLHRKIGLEAAGRARLLVDDLSAGLSGLHVDMALQQLNLVYRL